MSDTPEIDAAELYYDGTTGFVPIEDARKVERKLNKLREALEKISNLSSTTCLSFEAQSFKATSIACSALAEVKGSWLAKVVRHIGEDASMLE
jgi:hypothetical protein